MWGFVVRRSVMSYFVMVCVDKWPWKGHPNKDPAFLLREYFDFDFE